jgi:surfeit locus 1 family protein
LNGRAVIVLLATVLTVAVTARLGVWQLDRAAQKTALDDARQAQGDLPPLTGADLASQAAAAPSQWHRKARVDGVWIADATVYLRNRTMNGQAGFFVVTPLLLADGRVLVVQRGWLPRNRADQDGIAPYTTASGPVRLAGRIAPTPSRIFEMGAAASGPIRHNLVLADYARDLRRPLLPMALVQEEPASGDGLSRHWPEPASDVHKHYGYAVQWFGLSGLATALYVWYQLIRPRRRAAV